MKKAVCVLIAMLLAAVPVLGETYAAEDMFTMWYPDGWTRDEVSYTADNTDDYTWLADLYGSDCFTSVFLELVSGYDTFDLSQADEAETRKWMEDQFDRFTGYNPTYMETLYTEEEGLPFIVYTLTDMEVPLLEAVTVRNGVYYCIDISMDDGSALTEEAYDFLRGMVRSFRLNNPGQNASDQPEEAPQDGLEGEDGGAAETDLQLPTAAPAIVAV